MSSQVEHSGFYAQGVAYLQTMRTLALDSAMVEPMTQPHQRAIATWIGQQHQALNVHLQSYVHACHACLHPQARPSVQVFAVPLAPAFGLDGVCHHRTVPMTLFLDVGRVVPHHWLRLVVHEYAHAQVGEPGHHQAFAEALAHLCLGLGLEGPPQEPTHWSHWPTCQPTADALAFWQGQSGWFVTNH